jgi:hypothetical protein
MLCISRPPALATRDETIVGLYHGTTLQLAEKLVSLKDTAFTG